MYHIEVVLSSMMFYFIIGSEDITKLPKKMETIFDDSIEYIIRKTTFVCKFGIYINK